MSDSAVINEMEMIGHLKVIRQLGEGGFGKTYLVEDTSKPTSPRRVLKQYAPIASNESDSSRRLFDKEVEKLSQVGEHDQIPTSYGRFDDNDVPGILQGYIDGPTLAQKLEIEGPFTENWVRGFLQDLLPVLDFIHVHNLIHRDIKPSNIIYRRTDNKPCLVDFGAAKAVSETILAKTGTMIGTVQYIAPEQVRGKAGYSSDIYSLGVVCIQLLTNTAPFELMHSGTGAWCWRDYLVDNKVTEEFAQILDNMIVYGTDIRYSSATEVLTALHEIDEKVVARRQREELAQSKRREARLTVTKRVAMGAGVLLFVGSFGYFAYKGAEQLTSPLREIVRQVDSGPNDASKVPEKPTQEKTGENSDNPSQESLEGLVESITSIMTGIVALSFSGACFFAASRFAQGHSVSEVLPILLTPGLMLVLVRFLPILFL